MVTIEEMKAVVGHKVLITCKGHIEEEIFVESYQYEPDDDEEPFLLLAKEKVVYQSQIEKISFVE